MSLPNRSATPLTVLQYRDFRLLWMGQVSSLVGTRMQSAALLWHVYELTHSEYALGWIGLARLLPLIAFALIGGVLADALNRRMLMLFSQSMMALLAGWLSWATLNGYDTPWLIYAVAGFTAGIGSLDAPARQSLTPLLIPRELLAKAVSLNSISSQLASIAGPALMGLVVAQLGVGWVYAANAVSFGAVIAALLLMRPVSPGSDAPRPRVSLQSAVEGLRFVLNSRLLLSLMVLDFLASFFSSASILLPVYARDILKVGPAGYGWLSAAASVGAVAAALGLSLAPPIRRQGAAVLAAVFCYGLATIAFGLSRSFWICFLALVGTGAADTVSMVLRQTIRQLYTPDEMRGRMTAINMLFVRGGPQLGELEAGLVAGWLGAPFSVISGGIGCLFVVLGIASRFPRLLHYKDGESELK
ncbi:MAG: MFS transporter [Armatimonadota bacterium]